MIIVSQDKKRTVENFNLGIREAGEYNQNYVIYNTEIGEDLGEYKTEERTKEVLQEIIKVYKFYNGKTYLVEDSNNLIGKYQYGVYEMPEEGDYEK